MRRLIYTILSLILSIPIGVAEETPQYGGVINIGTVSITLSALSWDPTDWVWKQNHDTGMTREQLIDEVWGSDISVTLRTIDTHLKRLREKLREGGELIDTVRGVGYRFRREGGNA